MTLIWALMCAVCAVWATLAQWRLSHQRRVNRVAVAVMRHWRQQAQRARTETLHAAVPMVPVDRVQRNLERNRGRR